MALSPNALQPFIWGRGGAALTPEQVAREREIAEALVAQGIDTSPVGHWTQGAARMANVLAGKIREGRAASAESAGRAAYNERLSALFDGAPMASTPPQLGGSPATSTAMATAPAPDSASARVAQAHGDSSKPAGEWLQYANQSATRNLPLNDRLVQAMSFLPELGVTMKVVSGGQVGKGEKGRRVGSTRHDHGNAADVDFYMGGRKLTPKNEADRAILSQIVQRGKAAGITGWGEGDDYMGSGRVHLGFGNPGVWGAGGRGANAPEWLTQAYNTPYAPASAVAANEAMATGQLATAAQPSNAALSTAVQGYAPIVAETPEAIMAAEAAMMDPAFAGTGRSDRLPAADPAMAPALPEPRMVDDLPVADIARSLTGATLADDRVPMAGGSSSFAPVGTQAPNVSLPAGAQFTLPPPQQQVAQSLAQGGGQPSMQQLIELASDPWATPAQRQVVGALLQQQMDAADPYRQAQLQKMQLELEQMRNPRPSASDQLAREKFAWEQSQAGQTNTIREYDFYANQARQMGQEPVPFDQWDIARRREGGTTVNNVMGGEKFGEEFAKGDASALAEVSQSGMAAQRNIARIDRLDQILKNTPQGAMASWQQMAGQYGLNTEGLDNIQAAQALINALVPEQRPPGSGPMSDADLELFKQSLPRIINQPGGNEMIINTMRAVAQYDAEGADIVQALRRGEIDRAQAFEALQARQNPLAGLDDIITPSNAPKRREINGYVIEQVD